MKKLGEWEWIMGTNDKLIALWTSRYSALMEAAKSIESDTELKRDLIRTATVYQQCANELCDPPEGLFVELKIA